MKIDIRDLINRQVQTNLGYIRHYQSELGSAYSDERESLLKEIDRLRNDTRDMLDFMQSDIEILKGELESLF